MASGEVGTRELSLMYGLPQTETPNCYRSHENAKKRSYDQRIREVEHGSFTPLILSCTGGMGRAAVNTYKRLAALISTKRDDTYSNTMGWIQCRLSFSLLRAAIMCKCKLLLYLTIIYCSIRTYVDEPTTC